MSLRRFLDFAKELGVEGVELGYYWRDEERERAEARRWVAEAGLTVSAYLASNNFALEQESERRKEIEKVKHAVDGAEALGTDLVRVFAGKGTSFERGRDLVAAALRECIAYASPKGIRLAMENHGGIGGTSEHLLYYRGQLETDLFGFVVDVANFRANSGEEPLGAVRRVASGALLVQVKDGVLNDDGTWTPRLCGEGGIPLEESLNILHQADYQGYVSIEYEVPVDYNVGIPKEVSYLRSLLRRLDRSASAQ